MAGASDGEGAFIYSSLISSLNENPLRKSPYVGYWYENFDLAFEVFREATSCYDCGNYEACAVMCRNSVDSFLYLATRLRIIRDQTYRDADAGIAERIYDTTYVMDHEIQEKVKAQKEIQFRVLEPKIIDLLVLSAEELRTIDSFIRKAGNFSAHLMEAQDKEKFAWHETHKAELNKMIEDLENRKKPDFSVLINSRKKVWTSKQEALELLKTTSRCLDKIVTNYYTSEKTIKDIYRYP